MSSAEQNDAAAPSGGSSIWQNRHVRRVIIYAAVLAVAFLLGFVPMWMSARERARERDAARHALGISTLQNALASAAIDARQGRYEPARQSASDFFTNLGAEIERGPDSVFDETQRNNLRSMFAVRDDTITLLARSDPASSDRLVELYNTYRQATGGGSARP
ncbi:MAG TPA: hypothetical protein VNZ44_18020 [Pyrinomonadaceae bacterium]|nr:hypothetical protein [Pyrinomonadaceae bacterium]